MPMLIRVLGGMHVGPWDEKVREPCPANHLEIGVNLVAALNQLLIYVSAAPLPLKIKLKTCNGSIRSHKSVPIGLTEMVY